MSSDQNRVNNGVYLVHHRRYSIAGRHLVAMSREYISVAVALMAVLVFSQSAQSRVLADYLPEMMAEEVFPGASKFGAIAGDPDGAPILDAAGTQVGFAFLNTDFTPTIGYSGKPIYVVIGLDNDGIIRGAKLVEHTEPIVLVGIPDKKIRDFIDGYAGMSAIELSEAEGDAALPVDIVSGATVTVIVIDDSLKRAAIGFARARGLGGLKGKVEETGPRFVIDKSIDALSDWETLLGDGSVRRLNLSVSDVNEAFVQSGNVKAIERPEDGGPDDVFIDIHAALVSQPTIGRTLLGEGEYKNLQDRLADGQHALIFAANGQYSFRGSGFVRGGIFDRFQVIQGEDSWLFRDKAYKRLGSLGDATAPDFSEIGLFYLPDDGRFDPSKPWRLQLLIQRAVGPIERAFVTKDLPYQIPSRFLIEQAPVEIAADNDKGGIERFASNELWMKIWQSRQVDIVIMLAAVGVLTLIFFSQVWLVQVAGRLEWVRIVFLSFTLFWIGFYANAQLSIVNVFTFTNSLLTDFSWDYFLMDPMLFILWSAVAAAMIFWGRGAYCGWLCPFGAAQELLNKLAKRLKIPQIEVPWVLHELLWPVKYMIFLGLFGLSLYSLPLAERWAEIEPFKTAIILKFAREWPFVIYAVTLLSVGLFIERFYCRYLCPLGAALAIPGRLRINDWLKRYNQCGSPCQRCHNECMVQAIHPEGHINPNECLNCLHCQELYRCDQRCPVMIQKRLRREKLHASSKILEEVG